MHRAIRLYSKHSDVKWVGMVGETIFVYYDWEYINNVLAHRHSTDIQVRQVNEKELVLSREEWGADKSYWLHAAFYCFLFTDYQETSDVQKKFFFEMLWNWTSNMEEI